jgi:hypothetical protein
MNKEKMLKIAERNLRKAKMAMYNNAERTGIADVELENLTNNVEYAQVVCDLITKYVD